MGLAFHESELSGLSKERDKKQLKQRELKKHAATIHCANALSLLQRKISNALLYHAYPELMLKEEHEISVKQLCQLINYQGNNHSVIKEALKALLSTVIEWNLTNDRTGVEDWTASSILASVSLQGPLCYYAYSPRMKQLLYSPSMFGRIDLFIQAQFRSSYGLALYENCIRYRGLPFTKWIDMDTFRKLMGVPSEKYPIFRDFKKRVLDKSIQEVNSYSDLLIAPEIQREGRVVTKLRFSLKERPKKTRLGGHKKEGSLTNEQSDLQQKLVDHYGFSKEQARHLLQEYSTLEIGNKMALIEASANYQNGKIENLSAYLVSALRFNYQESKIYKKNTEKNILHSSLLEKEVSYKQIIEEIQADYQHYRIKKIDKAVENLSIKERKIFIEKFYQQAQVAISTVLHLQPKKYTHETVLDSPQIRAIFRQFIEQELEINDFLSLNDYVGTLTAAKQEVWMWYQNRQTNKS